VPPVSPVPRTLPRPSRLGLWLGLWGAASALLYRDSWLLIAGVVANPFHVVDERMVHAWGVLALCLLGLFLKRRAIRDDLRGGPSVRYAAFGLGCCAASPLLFPPAALLAGGLGLFALLFGQAARWPALLMLVYLATVSFPTFAESVADVPLGTAAIVPMSAVLEALGYPVVRMGQTLSLADAAGQPIVVQVTAACAGPATMAVFLALFALMAMDVRLPWRPTAFLLAVGILGTWAQNVGRLVYLMLVGYYRGEPALWEAHADSGYLLFISWYVLFALLYFAVAARYARAARRPAALSGTHA
jgi:exosortase/archaeosortase family protein